MPIQQIAYSVKCGAELTQEQEEFLNQVIPIEIMTEAYSSHSPDPIKGNENFNTQFFNDNFSQYLKIWIQLAPNNLKNYEKAWLEETIGYWKIGYPQFSFIDRDDSNGAGGIQYKDIIYKITGQNCKQWIYDRAGFVSLASMAAIVLYLICYYISRKKYQYIIAFIPLFITWAGLMLGSPRYCEFRYMFIYPLALPVILFIGLAKKDKKQI